MRPKLTFGSLFAGIGGFDLGFERTGLSCAWQVEIDKDACRVLEKHWPGVKRLPDVRECGRKNLPRVDVVTFGSPCQDMSVAGKREGIRGKKSVLFFEAVRIVSELRPTLAIWENVPGALSSNAGRDFLAAVRALHELGARDLAWRTLDAQYRGLAQRRQRVFLVCDFTNERASEILFESPCRCGHPPARGEAEPAVAPGTGGGTEVASSLTGSGGRRNGAPGMWGEVRNNLIPASVFQANGAGTFRTGSPSLSAGDDNGSNQVVLAPVAYQYHGNNVGPTGGVPFAAIQDGRGMEKQQNGFGISTEGVSYTLDGTGSQSVAHAGQGVGHDASEDGTGRGAPIIGLQMNFIRETRMRDLAGTINAQPSNAQFNGLFDQQQMTVRRLMPVECCRLQGFPDDWLDLHQELSDSAKYRLLGNAVAVPVAQVIAERVVAALEKSGGAARPRKGES